MYTSSPSGDSPRPPSTRASRLLLVAAALGSLLLGGALPAAASGPAPTPGSAGWTVDLGPAGADEVNLAHTAGALRVASPAFHPAAAGSASAGFASQTEAAHTLSAPVNRVTADLQADLPAGASAVVDVRGRAADGSWSEWREATSSVPADLPAEAIVVQSRITLQDATAGARIRGLRLHAERTADPLAVAQPAAVGARVYATREGLVGGTTANGHVIKSSDHFVALPSGRGLSPNGSGQYSVQVCGPARCETAPVWDVGPWNTQDDYWNPSSVRQTFQDLAQGVPEAQAAYQSGYNGGHDGFGRTVSNPAGIDLADGTFYNVGLNDNGWVTVTYLWTSGGTSGSQFTTWGTGVRIHSQANTGSSTVATLGGPTNVTVSCQVHGQLVNAEGYSNDGWAYLPGYGGYISNIYIDVPDAWLPGVPTC
ncbi:hypothetical protein NMG29_09735 [Streptomyces cocklensis]|uniref:Secreted protein n=1 Tax=Actinacidiphila cocklensis TaxID=887465 RepID=A0A9W4GMX1_9ACTN|nr:hypothetical protein [Actinacidiphila cocklensis]MDD1058495.1 hypothetical protein [Actinacidiphila cocklensis]WSX75298.1 hypothetical protein OH826_16170 [Streptomyces sp. NBC_00899]CAG6390655.1 conserved exported hypothetical protein [Actinacidiphila cocklensis]